MAASATLVARDVRVGVDLARARARRRAAGVDRERAHVAVPDVFRRGQGGARARLAADADRERARSRGRVVPSQGLRAGAMSARAEPGSGTRAAVAVLAAQVEEI